ncbi:MAG: LysM peptidoglycan-binding domain-containing protein [Anaerolineae bacterium]|nr:LysM peptidoglycan-binding domain-containing protein [Anaerolineae bacterium]
MSEQTEQPKQERKSSVSSADGPVWVWVASGVVIGLALFSLSMLFARAGPSNRAVPTANPTSMPAAAPALAATAAPAADTNTPTLITYTVKAGDVLGAIAEQFGISTQAILQANASTLTNPDRLQIGQLLIIPVSSEQAAPQTQSAPPAQTTTPGPPTPTPLPASAMQRHTIARGEVLSTIAERYGILVEAIRAANNLSNDTIRAGDTLLIPIPRASNAPAITAPPVNAAAYNFSVLEGDLAVAYPLTRNGSNFTAHYQPDTPAAKDIREIVTFVEQAQRSIVRSLGVRFTGRFDVYLAGTLFAPPDQALRGRSFSARRTIFVLYDDSGNGAASAAEKRYMLAHELTHLIAWNTYGAAKSPMLSEGTAVFAGEPYLLAGKFLPIKNFCLAYRRADVLPLIASPSLTFGGHLLSQDVYYASGCFVQYLIKTYGAAKFGKLYSNLDYEGVYGRSLAQLQRAWLASLDADNTRLPFSAEALPPAHEALLKDYAAFFERVGNNDVDTEAYRQLDQRRVNVLMGKPG